ncbi:MAG: hypothetical protein JW797_20690 [Bradymonadales bacterium]|nr:hypothetical protein [Bradymonadales bacterium]
MVWNGSQRTPGAIRYFTGQLNDFELFCAYHLGLDSNGAYCRPTLQEVARRFGTEPAQIEQALHDYGLSSQRVQEVHFDMEAARLDIEVAPPGIDRVELARTIFQEYLDAGTGLAHAPHYLVEEGNGYSRSNSGLGSG